MYKVIIVNKSNFSREVQRFGVNEYRTLHPGESTSFETSDLKEVRYYEELNKFGFEVYRELDESDLFNEIIDNQTPVVDEIPKEVEEVDEESEEEDSTEVDEVEIPEVTKSDDEVAETQSEEVQESEELDFSSYSDEELKTAMINLGSTKTRISARWKIEEEIRNLLPEGESVSSYL